MQLKRESAEEPRKKHHLIKRLRKSADISAELESLCAPEGVVDTRTRLDVQAYAALMAAYLVFEQQKWQEALDKFGESRYGSCVHGCIDEWMIGKVEFVIVV